MVDLGGPTLECSAKVAKLYIPSGTFIGVAKNWRAFWGNRQEEEPVCGTDIPRIITSVYHGEFEAESLYTTDLTFYTLVKPNDTTKEVDAIVVEWEDKDNQAAPVTKKYTLSVKFDRFERFGPANADGVIRLRVHGILTARPAAPA